MRRTEYKDSSFICCFYLADEIWHLFAHEQKRKSAQNYTSLWYRSTVSYLTKNHKSYICLRMHWTEDKIPAVPAAGTVLMKSDTCLRMRRTQDKFLSLPSASTILMKSDGFCTWAGPEFSSKLCLFLLPYYCISPVRNLTFVCACAGPKISFQLYLLLAPFWWNPEICLRMSRNGIQLQTMSLFAIIPYLTCLTFVCSCSGPEFSSKLSFFNTVLLYLTCQKSDICLRMRRTEDSFQLYLRLELFWWNLTLVCACAGPKISFQLYLRLELFWWNLTLVCTCAEPKISF